LKGEVGQNVLDIALDNDLHIQHNCGGVCGCSTCHVYIEKGMETLPDISDAEEDRIDLAENPKINSRLSCQCVLGERTTDLVVKVPPQNFLGH
jgi:ferredoxin, 2Fe-2S